MQSYQAVTHATGTVRLDGDGFHGADLTVEGGFRGVALSFDAEGQRLRRPMDPDGHGAGGIDLGLRLSLFGLLTTHGDHRLEHWFDLGGEGGAGGGFSSVKSFGQAWIGGWVEIGLWPGPNYPALIFDIRQTTYTSEWTGQTVFGIGLSFARRFVSEETVGL